MVRLGCLSDIHGNRTALEAVIADATDRGVQQWWALGALVAVGPDPLGTLEMLANLPDVLVTSGTVTSVCRHALMLEVATISRIS